MILVFFRDLEATACVLVASERARFRGNSESAGCQILQREGRNQFGPWTFLTCPDTSRRLFLLQAEPSNIPPVCSDHRVRVKHHHDDDGQMTQPDRDSELPEAVRLCRACIIMRIIMALSALLYVYSSCPGVT